MTFFTLTIIFRHYFFHNIATYNKNPDKHEEQV